MSLKYDEYLAEHVGAVQKGWNWIKDHLINQINEKIRNLYPEDTIGPFDALIDIYEIDKLVEYHDMSKTKPDEYYPYDAWFYGGNPSYATKIAFETAFLKHVHRNPHHWQYWILTHDDPNDPETLIEMPLSYIFEMICDWWSFSWKKGDLFEIFSWWDEYNSYVRMHKRSREVVEKILSEMKTILEAEHAEE